MSGLPVQTIMNMSPAVLEGKAGWVEVVIEGQTRRINVTEEVGTILASFWASKVGTSPETLDTIQEIAEALKNNPDIIQTLEDAIAGKVSTADLATQLSGILSPKRYDLPVITHAGGAMDVAAGQVFAVNSNRSISGFSNVPSNRALTIVIKITGSGAVTWPAGISWADGLAPTLGASWTIVTIAAINGTLHGSVAQAA